MGAIFQDFIQNLSSLRLPSPLWGVHLDPQRQFIALLRVSLEFDKLSNEKAVLLKCENETESLRTIVYINDEIIDIPSVTFGISDTGDLEKLIYDLENMKFCLNSQNGNNCRKYLIGTTDNICEACAFEIEDTQKYLDNLPPFNEEFLTTSSERLEDTKEKKCLCTVCGKTFSSNPSLRHHMLTHSNVKPFSCNICLKSFAKKYNLEVHSRIHSGERPYICSKCGKTYTTRSNLSTHLNSFHTEVKKHACEYCQMTFVHPRVLRIHVRKHTGEKPYRCQVCQKSFSKNIHLTVHMRTHTGERPHKCKQCHKTFTTSGNLNSHMRNNHK